MRPLAELRVMPREGDGRQLEQPLAAREDEGREVGWRLQVQFVEGVLLEEAQRPDRRGTRECQRDQECRPDEQVPSTANRSTSPRAPRNDGNDRNWAVVSAASKTRSRRPARPPRADGHGAPWRSERRSRVERSCLGLQSPLERCASIVEPRLGRSDRDAERPSDLSDRAFLDVVENDDDAVLRPQAVEARPIVSLSTNSSIAVRARDHAEVPAEECRHRGRSAPRPRGSGHDDDAPTTRRWPRCD